MRSSGLVEVAVADHRLDGGPCRKGRFVLQDAPADRLLLIDDDGIVRGMALRDREDGRWIGWMRGTGSTAGAPDIVVDVLSQAHDTPQCRPSKISHPGAELRGVPVAASGLTRAQGLLSGSCLASAA